MKFLLSFLLTVCFFFPAIGEEKKKYSPEKIQEESKKANDFFEKVFNDYADRNPIFQTFLGIKKDYGQLDDLSDSAKMREQEIVKQNLEFLKKEINYEALDDQTKLSYRLFVYNATLSIEGFKYRFHDYPVNQMSGWQSELPSFMINIHVINDSSDALAYISRLNKFDHFIDQLIDNLRIREEKGIILPKFLFPLVIDDCKNIIKGAPFEADSSNSTLLEDFDTKLQKLELPESRKKLYLKKAEKALLDSVKPAYEKLILYLIALEKKADVKAGVWKFPEGDNFYKYALKNTTSTNLSGEQIYQTGLKEVERIHGEMKKIMKKVNYPGSDLKKFFVFMKTDKRFYFTDDEAGKKQYLDKSMAIIDSMKLALDQLFIKKPKAGLIVKAVEPFREKSAGQAFYQDPAPNGTRPGIYYVNLYSMATAPIHEMEALAYHEAIPGHHMQISIAQELQDIPKFRKYGILTAYVEGWGLYSELVPKEIGFYKNPYSDFGRLSMELWRACRLVVDVGIHQKKWSREQAIDYLKNNTSASELECIKSIERYIVLPSQATAYKVGMMKIVELREAARKKLGSRFDIREYHDTVLKYGALPLNELEQNVNNWINQKLKM